MLSFWKFIFILALSVCPLSHVSGWALDLREFGSCRSVHLGLLNSSHKYLDWATNIIPTNPYLLWTITTWRMLPISQQLSIHAKRSLCTLNLVITGGESKGDNFIHFASSNLNTLRPHMHSTYIAIREHSNSISAENYHRAFYFYPFRVIFADILEHEENLSFYYFCPVCLNPTQPVLKNELRTLSNKRFQSDWNSVIVGVISDLQVSGFSTKQCLQNPSSPNCLNVAIVEVLSHFLNFTISYHETAQVCKHGFIQRTSWTNDAYNPNISQPLKVTLLSSHLKYKGFFLFYCIPKNVTNIMQQEGIQTWVAVFENRFWLVFIISLFLITLVCSLPLGNQQIIVAPNFMRSLGNKFFYICSALMRQDIPSNQRAIWGYSFVVALFLYLYENEFTAYVIVESEPPPYRSSPDVIANNYTVVYHIFKAYYEDRDGWDKKTAEEMQNQMVNSGFLKSKNQFEIRVVDRNGSASGATKVEQIRSALFEKVAVMDRSHAFANSFSIFPMVAELTHQTNWMNSDSVCFVTKSDITINPISWFPFVYFKFESLKTVNIIEQTGIEGYWNDQFNYNKSIHIKTMMGKGDYADVILTPFTNENGLVSMKQLRPMVILSLYLMELAGVTFLIENVHGRTLEEIIGFIYHVHCEIWLFILQVLSFLNSLFKRIWKLIVCRGRKRPTIINVKPSAISSN